MESETFKKRGRDMLDYIATYWDTLQTRPPLHSVAPGYLRQLIPDRAPEQPESWEEVIKDIERVVMPGMTHWHNPQFHAYFTTANSYPSILADMLSDALGCIGFTWNSSPACTELEVNMMDWLANMLQLPSHFLFSEGTGGGIIQSTASDSTVMVLLAARTEVATRLKKDNPNITQGQIIDKLVAYTSDMAHSSAERAGLIGFVKTRNLPTDDKGSLRGATLEKAMKEDIAQGLLPFFVCATVGTTSACSFDNLLEIGPICKQYNVWFHIDAAYAGSACICPEFRYLIDGVENCTTFNFNPHKWMGITFDCSALWVKERSLLNDAFSIDPLYLKHEHQDNAIPDFRHWQIPLGRRFRSLKIWFVLRLFGVQKLRERIRKDVKLAKLFESLVRKDDKFELVGDVVLGLVCFRLKDTDEMNEKLLTTINSDHRIHIVPSNIFGKYTLRFAVCSEKTQEKDVHFAWDVVKELSDKLTLDRHKKC